MECSRTFSSPWKPMLLCCSASDDLIHQFLRAPSPPPTKDRVAFSSTRPLHRYSKRSSSNDEMNASPTHNSIIPSVNAYNRPVLRTAVVVDTPDPAFPPLLEVTTPENQSAHWTLSSICMSASKSVLCIGCMSRFMPFMRLAQHLAALRTWCK